MNEALPKLLRAIAAGTRAQEEKMDVLFEAAANELEQLRAIADAAKRCVEKHDVVISAGGVGWQRHVEEPLRSLRKSLRRAGIR
jgi:hypothetical protein